MTIRTDPTVEEALERLLADRVGETRSDVVRTAILELERSRRRAKLRAESAALRDDPAEQALAKEMAAELEDLGAW